MAYSKLIISGNICEQYEYERTPAVVIQRPNVLRGLLGDRKLLSVEQETSERFQRRQDSANRAKLAFGRLCASNFDAIETAVFVTLTFETSQRIQGGYKLFGVFTKRLRRRYGAHVRYIAVPEFGTKRTKRFHFHALFWGLPLAELVDERTEGSPFFRSFAGVWQYGYTDVVITDNNVKVGYYLGKYLTKAYQDKRLFNHASYVTSRNIRRSIVYTSFIPFILDYELELSTAQVVKKKSYDTLHLGRCDYTLFDRTLNALKT